MATMKMTISGNTYNAREDLKKDGFRWNPELKVWTKLIDTTEVQDELTAKYRRKACAVNTITLQNPSEKKYFVKEGWIFNLESMHDKVWCLLIDVQEGTLHFPLEVAGKSIKDESDLYALLDEASELESAAKSGKVTGYQYSRIKEIVHWRVEQRYAACLASGMDESDAAGCFEDL